jgi:hypothetical protein
MSKPVLPYIIVAMLAFCIASCIKEPDLGPQPVISFNSIKYFPRSKPTGADCIEVKINFEDGDGDLGLDEGDTTGPFKRFDANGNINNDFFNYFIDIYLQNSSGNWEPYVFPPGVPTYNGRFPRINSPTKRKTIQGTLSYYLRIFSTFPFRNRPLKFKLRIQDRALNSTNYIDTDEIIIPS